MRVCVDACVFSCFLTFFFSFINSQPCFDNDIIENLLLFLFHNLELFRHKWNGRNRSDLILSDDIFYKSNYLSLFDFLETCWPRRRTIKIDNFRILLKHVMLS